jgi:hypothetical protein
MPTPDLSCSATTYPQAEPTLKHTATQLTPSNRFHRHRLRRLHTMPEWMWAQCIKRFLRGDQPIAVARWILSHEDCGGVKGLNLHTLRQYLGSLAWEVKRQQARHQSGHTMLEVQQEVRAAIAEQVPPMVPIRARPRTFPVGGDAVCLGRTHALPGVHVRPAQACAHPILSLRP